MEAAGPNQPWVLQIPNITVHEELGRGAESVVFRATHEGQVFAVKVHHPTQGEIGLRLRREAAFVARLKHPGLASILEVGEVSDRAYLVMEYIRGATLKEFCNEKPLDQRSLITISKIIAGALGEAHKLGIVHRDVKPQNILVPSPDKVKLIDFGFARQAQPDEVRREVVGTLLYSAPEQTGMLNRPVDARSDLYSLGVVMFECATGSVPFQSNDIGELLRQHAVVVPPNPRDLNYLISPVLAAIINKLLAKDPDDRYQSAKGLVADLDSIDELDLSVSEGASLVLEQAEAALSFELPLIGREKEMVSLQKAWRGVMQGSGGIILFEGQPGTGKSRLARELLERAKKDGALLLSGKASAGDALPFGVIRQAIDGHLRHLKRLPEGKRRKAEAIIKEVAGEYAPLLRRLSPHLAKLLDDGQSPTSEAMETFHSIIAEFLLRLRERFPALVLFIDDIQWVDDSSRHVLKALASAIQEQPFLLAITARNDPESAGSLNKFVEEMKFAIRSRVATQPLKEEDVGRMVGLFLGGGAIDPNLVRQLAIRTGGNPFAVKEYVRALLDSGFLVPSWGKWVLNGTNLDALQLSDDAIQLVLMRLNSLEDLTRQILGVAALIGSRFSIPLLAAVFGNQEKVVLAALMQGQQENLIELADEGEYAFVHDRIQEALQTRFNPDQKKSIHQSIAEAMDNGAPASPDVVMAMAKHYASGNLSKNPKRVYEVNMEAGLNALEEYASAEAYDFLSTAKEAAEIAEIALDASFFQTLGEVSARTARLEEAEVSLRLAIDKLPERISRASTRARLIPVLLINFELARAWEETLKGFSETGFPWVRQRIFEPSAGLAYDVAEWIASKATGLIAFIYFLLGILVRWTRIGYGSAKGRTRERYTVTARLQEVSVRIAWYRSKDSALPKLTLSGIFFANRLGPSREMATAYSIFSVFSAVMSDSSFGYLRFFKWLSRGYSERAIKLAEQLGDRSLLGQVHANAAIAALFRGDIAESEARILSTMKDFNRWLHPEHHVQLHLIAGALMLGRGYFSEAALFGRRGSENMLSTSNDNPGGYYPLIYTAAGLAMELQPIEALENIQKVESRLDRFTEAQNVAAVISLQKLLYYHLQEDYGQELELAAIKYDELDIDLRGPYPLRLFYLFHSYARLANCIKDKSDEKLEILKLSLDCLQKSREPFLRAHLMVLSAGVAWLEGSMSEALKLLQTAEMMSSECDNPWAFFESLRLQGRLLISQGQTNAALRVLRLAASVANQYRWAAFSRQIQKEFGISVGGGGSMGSVGSVGSMGSMGSMGSISGSVLSLRSEFGSTSSSSFASGTKAPKSAIHMQRQLDALLQVSLASSSILDPEAQSRASVDAIIKLLGAERGYLFVLEKPSGKLAMKAGRTMDGNDIEEFTAYSSSVINKVLQSKQPVFFSGSETGEVVASESVMAHDLKSIMAAPLVLRDELVGILYLDNRLAKGVFTEDDVDVLLVVANQIAIAFETAQNAKQEQNRIELEKDLAVSAAVQSMLLPQNSSANLKNYSYAALFRPASQSGGDWWWCEQQPDGRLIVMIGDATGHGVGAAMVTAIIAGSYQSIKQATKQVDFSVLLRQLNASILELCREVYKMTFSLLEFDPNRNVVTWWSAGAPPVLVLRKTGKLEALTTKGSPLGSMAFQAGVSQTAYLPGDRMLVFSDGIIEAETNNGRALGLKRLNDFFRETAKINAEQSMQYIVDKFDEVKSQTKPQDDDITMVLIDRN